MCFRGSWKYEELKAVHIGMCVVCVSLSFPVFGCRDADQPLCKRLCTGVYVCVRVLKSYASRAELQRAFHMPKKNCGRKRPLIEHDARHLKLKSSATEKPQQAGISLAPLLKSSRASWDQPLCPDPDPHFPAGPPWASISLHCFRSRVWPPHGADGQPRLELDELLTAL